MRYQGINLLNPKAQWVCPGSWVLSFWHDYPKASGFMMLHLKKLTYYPKPFYSLKRVDTLHREN